VPFAALDFETTGLDESRDAVVSFGVVPVRGGRVVVGEGLHQLVSPAVPSSAASMRVHQILPRDLEHAAAPDAAAETLRAALEGRFLLAWYAGVELAFLRKTFGGPRRTWARRTVDVLRLAIELARADPEARFGLSATAARYGVPVSSPHEAFDDALVTAQLFLVLASKLEERGFGSVRSYLRLTRS
jgi:DNA polymerase-3 subunit epsilon